MLSFDWFYLEENHIWVFELTHDGGLSQEVRPGLVTGAGLQGFDGDTEYQKVSNFNKISGDDTYSMSCLSCWVSLPRQTSPNSPPPMIASMVM